MDAEIPVTLQEPAEVLQVQACQGGSQRAKVLSRYRSASVNVASHYDSYSKMVASTILLGRYKILRLPGWI